MFYQNLLPFNVPSHVRSTTVAVKYYWLMEKGQFNSRHNSRRIGPLPIWCVFLSLNQYLAWDTRKYVVGVSLFGQVYNNSMFQHFYNGSVNIYHHVNGFTASRSLGETILDANGRKMKTLHTFKFLFIILFRFLFYALVMFN